MTEQGNADAGSQGKHPIVRLILENPISALNTAAILFGGGIVYASNESRMNQMSDRITKIEIAADRETALLAAKDDRATQKVEAITRDLTDVKIDVRGIKSSVEFLVRQVQQQERRAPQ